MHDDWAVRSQQQQRRYKYYLDTEMEIKMTFIDFSMAMHSLVSDQLSSEILFFTLGS